MPKPMTSMQEFKDFCENGSIGQPYNPYDVFGSVELPGALMRDRSISPAAKLVYAYLCFTEKSQTIASLAFETGIDAAMAEQCLIELQKAELLGKEKKDGGR